MWLTQKLLAELSGVTTPTINEHIKNIYKEGELKESLTIRKFLIVQKEGIREVERETAAELIAHRVDADKHTRKNNYESI